MPGPQVRSLKLLILNVKRVGMGSIAPIGVMIAFITSDNKHFARVLLVKLKEKCSILKV